MGEKFFVSSLLAVNIRFPWKTENLVRHATEFKVTNNIVDIIYFEQKFTEEAGFVVAVEAKIKDWRRAIQQAYRDKLFADRAYVALPAEFASSAINHLFEFRRAQVGLIVLGDSKVKVYHHPPLNRQQSLYHVNTVRDSLNLFISKDFKL